MQTKWLVATTILFSIITLNHSYAQRPGTLGWEEYDSNNTSTVQQEQEQKTRADDSDDIYHSWGRWHQPTQEPIVVESSSAVDAKPVIYTAFIHSNDYIETNEGDTERSYATVSTIVPKPIYFEGYTYTKDNSYKSEQGQGDWTEYCKVRYLITPEQARKASLNDFTASIIVYVHNYDDAKGCTNNKKEGENNHE
ncbi:MAG: hypothetical protein KDK51_01120 [Deltaproteobacteria bacterium]|nr:hypothetical protein [Deltaproteobacteria bacterium]